MLRRPRADEDDEDLLKMQEDFLKKKHKEPSAAKCVRFSQTIETSRNESGQSQSSTGPIIGENAYGFHENEEISSNFSWCSLPIHQVTERQNKSIIFSGTEEKGRFAYYKVVLALERLFGLEFCHGAFPETKNIAVTLNLL